MGRGAAGRRLLLWLLFLCFCTVGTVYLPLISDKLPVLGRITYFQALLAIAALLGIGTLLRVAGSSERSVARTICRIITAYLLFEVLVVIPVAVWIGTANVKLILATMGVRVSWFLFPVMLTVCADDRTRRFAGTALAIAAIGLVVWGVYLAATGGGGYYMELGALRYRILGGGASILVAWPFALAVSGAVSRRTTVAFLLVAITGLMLINHRSDLIALAVAGAVCLAMSGQIRRVLPAIVPIALGALVIAAIWGRQLGSAFGYTMSHLFDIGSGNGADRMMRWRLAWNYIQSHPFNDYVWSWRYYSVNLPLVYQPHNFALEIAGQEGVAGVLFYGSVLWTALRSAWSWGRRDAEARALIGWLIAYIGFSLMNANHYLPSNMPILVGAVAALVSRVDWLRRGDGGSPETEVLTEAHA